MHSKYIPSAIHKTILSVLGIASPFHNIKNLFCAILILSNSKSLYKILDSHNRRMHIGHKINMNEPYRRNTACYYLAL